MSDLFVLRHVKTMFLVCQRVALIVRPHIKHIDPSEHDTDLIKAKRMVVLINSKP